MGSRTAPTLTCADELYANGIYYPPAEPLDNRGGSTVNVPGQSSRTTTITATGGQSVGIYLYSRGATRVTLNVGGETGGTAHVVNIRQGTSSFTTDELRNNGIHMRSWSSRQPNINLNVRRGVTIGTQGAPMRQHGVFIDQTSASTNMGFGAGGAEITTAATIYASRQGIRFRRGAGGTTEATTITNRGAISSGEHGIGLTTVETAMTGTATIVNTGAITVSGAYAGIRMDYRGAGAVEIDNAGTITATMGRGILLGYNAHSSSTAAVTLTNSGTVNAAIDGIRLNKANGSGAVTLTNRGAVTVTSAATTGVYALWLWESSAASGAVTIVNSGALRSKSHALYADMGSGNAAAIALTNSAAVTSEDGDGIRIERGVEGVVEVGNSGSVSGRDYGIYIGRAERIGIDSGGGTITARTGVYAEVSSASALGDTRSTDSDGNHAPAIDIAWTGGRVVRGTAENDRGRFMATSAIEVVVFDQEAAAVKAVEGTLRYGGAAGIEAHALSWRDVVAQVAKGDDPGAIANAAAQTAAVPTGATASDNAYVAQFRAALANPDLAVAAAVLTAIDSSATTVSDLSDAEIVAYLQTDDPFRRLLLLYVLSRGLSDGEKAVLRAVAANGDVDAALTAAGFSDDASDPNDYWSKVKALLDRYHLDDIRIAMTAGSIDSRGDGIRAYYATANDNNGGVSVTVAEGASVAGGKAGVHVANAGTGLMLPGKYTPGFVMGEDPEELVTVTHGEGMAAVPLLDQLVTVAGTVAGGTDAAVRLSGGGAVLVLEGGRVLAGSSGVGILVNDPGPALMYVDGEVKGGAGGAAAVHLTGGGSIIVGLNGRVRANGADYAIRSDGDAPTTLTLAINRLIPYREDVNAQMDGPILGIENVRLREDRNGVSTGYYYPEGLQVGPDGRPIISSLPLRPAFSCAAAGDRRCRLYEALPSMLIAMNALPSWAERASAPRDPKGGWARVEGSRGEWRAKKATTAGKLAYDHHRVVARAGMDFAPREDLRVGWSVHAPRGKAEMPGVGEIELDGVGAGVSATWRSGDFYVDAQAAVTRYDVGLESYAHGKLLDKDASGVGYALGLEAGRRLAVGETFVTPRAGLTWSKAGLDEFPDLETAGDEERRSRVSVEEARSLKGRAGVMVEKEVGTGTGAGLLYGSLDVEHEFTDETEMKIAGLKTEKLVTEAHPTALSLGAGAVFDVRENVVVRASAGYRASEGGGSGYGASLEMRVRF